MKKMRLLSPGEFRAIILNFCFTRFDSLFFRMNMGNRRRTCLFLFISTICIYTACAGDQKPTELHIVYSGSMNGTLDDCQCGGPVVGGMTRIISVIDSLRKQHPNMILLDAGDFLNSYSIPNANRMMLKLVSMARYTALNLGDQEFVEGDGFIFSENKTGQLKLPFISANLQNKNADGLLAAAVKPVNISGISVEIIGAIMPASFEFIHPQKLEAKAVNTVLDEFKTENISDRDIHILLFHGTSNDAVTIAQKHPWIDVIIMSHEQKQHFFQKNNTVFAETGGDGEYIGHLIVQKKGKSVKFKNDFIPILEDLPVNSMAKKIVSEYFEKIQQK